MHQLPPIFLLFTWCLVDTTSASSQLEPQCPPVSTSEGRMSYYYSVIVKCYPLYCVNVQHVLLIQNIQRCGKVVVFVQAYLTYCIH